MMADSPIPTGDNYPFGTGGINTESDEGSKYEEDGRELSIRRQKALGEVDNAQFS